MSKIIETVWNCPYCGTKGIRGREVDCPNCGRTRSSDTKFYLPDKLTYLDKDISEVSEPDWFCDYCESYNSANNSVCKNCGNPKANSKSYFDVLKEKGQPADLKEVPVSEMNRKYESHNDKYDCHDCDSEACSDTTSDGSFSDYFKKNGFNFDGVDKKNKILVGLLSSVGIIGIIIALLAIFIPKTKTITVDSLVWERNIEVEKNRLVKESDWSVPADAVEVKYTRSEVHHHDHVLDHYETVQEQKSRQVFDGYDIYYSYHDLGNGTAEQIEHKTPRYRTEYYYETVQKPVYVDVPVYQTKYYYTIWRYVHDHTETASGKITKDSSVEPYWPGVELKERQREGAKTQTYTVNAVCNKKNKNYTASYELWNSLKVGRQYTVKVSAGIIIKIVK